MTISQFMWGYQQSFRIVAEGTLERSLEAIGASALRPRITVIGFKLDGSGPYPICVEPENGRLQPEHLVQVPSLAATLIAADPESNMLHSHPVAHSLHLERVRQSGWRRAIVQAVDTSGVYPHRTHFCSSGVKLGAFEVFVLAGVEQDAYDRIPHLEGDVVDRARVARSLAEEVIVETLAAAATALHLPDPGPGGIGRDEVDIVRSSASYFARSCGARAGNLFAEIFEPLEAATSQRYEGTGATGHLLLAQVGHSNITELLRFSRAVSLRGSRAVRKLLEMTNGEVALLTDGGSIHGLGQYDKDNYDPLAQDVFEIRVPAHATWELVHAGTRLMRVSYGKASLPAPLVDRRTYDDTMERVFLGVPDLDVDAIWRLVEAAMTASHGTMLVISGAASSEAARLSGQATRVQPATIDNTLMRRISSIDGAVLVDCAGTCHAIGVILDGVATGRGDSARGARYNSAIRYLEGRAGETVIIIVSEDGSVNLVPELRPRISRSRIEDALTLLRSVSGPDADRETFNRAWEEVAALEFYLDQAQCDDANGLRDILEEASLAAGHIKIIFDRLAPSAEMNESYFLAG
jgi:hypothetical protein